ncbi:MAG: hypothetical protein AB3N14_14765 [Flavobacteriaceae bacterium]
MKSNALRIVCSVIFAWWSLKSLDIAFRTESADHQLYQAVGLGWLVLPAALIVTILFAVTVIWIWRPFKLGYKLCILGLVTEMVMTVGAGIISIANPDAAKSAFIASRESRGMSVQDEMIEMVASPVFGIIAIILGVVFCGIAFFLITRLNRNLAKSDLSTEN